MGNGALATVRPTGGAVAEVDREDDLKLIRETYGKDISESEFKILVADAQHRGLSVVRGEVRAIKFNNKMQPYVTIHGLRKIAEQSGKYAGSEGPFFCGPDGKWTEVWLSNDPPAAAKFIVYRHDSSRPIVGIATWKERSSGNSPTWKSMPSLMLGKVAESDAIKRARLVPDDIHLSIEDAPYNPRQAKVGALRHVHETGKARGLNHDQVRSVVKALRPGTTSLADDSITSRDLLAAAAYIEAVDDDALMQVVESEAIIEEPEGEPDDLTAALGDLFAAAEGYQWTTKAAELFALSVYPRDPNGAIRADVRGLTPEQVYEVTAELEGIGRILDQESGEYLATPEVEIANKIGAAPGKAQLDKISAQMKADGLTPPWLVKLWQRAKLTAKDAPDQPATAQGELLPQSDPDRFTQ